MKDLLKVLTVQEGSVDKYLNEGWEIIDTTKEGYGDGGFYLKYHLGLSTRSMMKKYKEIIDTYEDYGFKEQLFEKVAVNNGEKYEDYSNTQSGRRTKDITTDFMERYEKVVHDKEVVYFKKNDKDGEIYF
ncbi:hypothetical protein [Psychrobacillus sp. FSL H8-0487]|uniref:hypothetical protein n=1 Tax=Psychrobacillus sp. FSL H8-0487 TaxID=2921391 RepID=UPI0030F90A92